MHLNQILDYTVDDALIAEALVRPRLDPTLILEATAQIASFNYAKAKEDPRPKVLVLGRWQHPNTGNKLVCGINLNYLDDAQMDHLRSIMPKIWAKDSVKAKYWEAMALAPDIMHNAYRTYNQDHIRGVSARKLDFMEPEIPEPEQQKVEPLPKPPPEEKAPEEKPKEEPKPAPAPKPEPKLTPEPKEEPGKEPIHVPVQPKPPGGPEKHEIPTPSPEGKPEAKTPPVEKPKHPLLAKIKRGIANLVGRLKSRLHRNRATPLEREQEVNKLRNLERRVETTKEPTPKTPEAEVDKLKDVEQQGEVQDLKKLEDEHNGEVKESFEDRLSAILESYALNQRARWRSHQHYIEAHQPKNFFGYDPYLGGMVMDYANGSKLVAIHNITEGKTIIDLVDDPTEILTECGWDWSDTVRLIATPEGVKASYEHPRGGAIAEAIINSTFGSLLREACIID